jgi:DNA-directed RNA polymerase subunit beta
LIGIDLKIGDKLLAKAGDPLSKDIVEVAKKNNIKTIPLVPFVSNELIYLDAEFELGYKICPASVKRDKYGNILEKTTYVRESNSFKKVHVMDVDLIDVVPAQIGGLGLSLIPFVANDDLNRAFYSVRTLNQAVPLIKPQSPFVGTGFEGVAVKTSGRTVFAEDDGIVKYADASKVVVEYTSGKKKRDVVYEVEKFLRTNQDSCFNQVVKVVTGTKFKKGDVLVDGPSTENGELALGANLETAFMVWDGYNYEDGIVISDRLVKEDVLTSVHIKEYTQEVRETKLGDEIITRDIPGVGERALRHLGEDGVVRVGANVEAGDILVGIITPKGESELTAEEKLLRAIFGEYARDVKDNSLRMPYGERGIVIGVQVLDRSKGAKLGAGVLKQVKVWVAKTHKIQVGDKLSGFHGDKGLIAKIVPQADMPHKADGTPIDIIVGPTSMVRRMNLGQLIEAHAGAICQKLGIKAKVEPFSEYSLDPLIELAKKAGIDYSQKIDLYDGRTGKKFEQKVTVGYKYFLKLEHLAEHKVHARSTGPYTLVTQQPLRGKAQRGGQRLGEMEVWALESHAVPSVLHEMLTIKSDDIVGRAAAYKAIISAQPFTPPNIPESFNVLDRELAGLAIKLDKIQAEEDNEIDDLAIEEIVDSIGNEN